MATQREWKFSARVDDEDKVQLAEDVAELESKGWEPVTRDRIAKDFVFRVIDEALTFHSLVSASSKANQHHATITLAGEKVSVVWITHEPKPSGLSRDDYKMALICDTIAGVMLDDPVSWAELATQYGHEQPTPAFPQRLYHFKNHSKVMDFICAMGVAAKLQLGPPSLTSTYSSVKLNFAEGEVRPELALWLQFVTRNVVRPDDRSQVRNCGDAP